MKTKDELNVLKEEVEALNNKLCELTTEELEQVTGGKLDKEAQQWWIKNYEEIVERAKQKGNNTYQHVKKIAQVLVISSGTHTLEDVKKAFGRHVDIDDLD